MTTQLTPPTVLFVDDDSSLLQGVRRNLRRESLQLLFAASAAEALALLERGGIDVIVSDQDMPGVRGTELLEQVSQRWPLIVRLLLTGRPSFETAVEAVNRGQIYRFLVKPCESRDLVIAIRQGLERRDLVLGADSLIRRVREQDAELRELEQKHPGITHTKRDADGSILIDETAAEADDMFRRFETLVEHAMRASDALRD